MQLTPLFAVSGGVGFPNYDIRPDTSDPLIAAIRPNGRSIATIEVAQDGSKDYTTIRAAVAQALALQTAQRIAEGNPTVTPNYRVDILVYPGTYIGDFAPPPFTAYYLVGPAHSAIVKQDVAEAIPLLGVLATNGNLYWEGIDIELLYQAVYPSDNPKYPVHATNMGTSIWVNTTFNNSGGNFGGTPFGMDGQDGGTTLMYNCVLTPGNLNCHGWDYTRVPQNMMYVNCTCPATVNWDALNNIAVDHLWVIGGNVYGIRLEGNASKLHQDPATVVGAGGVVAPSTDNNVNWPIPYGGLSATDKSYWGMP